MANRNSGNRLKGAGAGAAVTVQSAGACAVNMPKALHRVKRDVGALVPEEQVEEAFRESGHVWRERKFGPVATLHLFLLQVLSFNTAITALRHLSGAPVNAASYCRARARLPLAALQGILRRSAAAIREQLGVAGEVSGGGGGGEGGGAAGPPSAPSALSAPLWRGLRALLVDGSSSITLTRLRCRRSSGSRSARPRGVGSPRPSCWASSTPSPGRWWRCSPARSTPARWAWSAACTAARTTACTPCWGPGTCSSGTAGSAPSRTWRCCACGR